MQTLRLMLTEIKILFNCYYTGIINTMIPPSFTVSTFLYREFVDKRNDEAQ